MDKMEEEQEDQQQAPDQEMQQFAYGPRISPPITLLQEICSRNGFTAEYQLLSTEGSVHEPTFKIAVTVGDITVTASGQSKKKARHAAAREAIEKLRGRENLNFDGINFESMTSIGEPTTKSVYAMATNEANPVGKLQEICMKMRVNPPDYDTINETGLAHERIFILSCTIASLNMTTLGEGRSKKLAKRQAAEHMLTKLETSEIYDKTSNSKASEHGNANSNGGNSGISSLNMDSDDNAHFVKARTNVTELNSYLDKFTISDLRTDISMIEVDTVNRDLFYELFLETFINGCELKSEFEYITDSHCILKLLDENDNMILSTLGYGEDNHSAMKSAVINTYKSVMVLKNPLIGRDSHLHHQEVGKVAHQRLET